jgi:cytochrome c peroxidase
MKTTQLSLLAVLFAAMSAQAETVRDFAGRYESAARAGNASFSPSAARGAEFFRAKHGQEWSCASCHTSNPAAAGQHATTAKPIAPLAPAANPERFTSADKVEKWFKRNCKDVLGRECTPA